MTCVLLYPSRLEFKAAVEGESKEKELWRTVLLDFLRHIERQIRYLDKEIRRSKKKKTEQTVTRADVHFVQCEIQSQLFGSRANGLICLLW